jgi:hypothetical protein
MRYENSTTCTRTVRRRDVRTVEGGLVVIGRSPELTTHYKRLAGDDIYLLRGDEGSIPATSPAAP